MLIAAGADINYREPEQDGGGTPAIDAASVGFFEGVYVLLEAGADIRPHTTGGWDLTYEVARHQIDPNDDRYPWREKVLQLLRERGADVDGALRRRVTRRRRIVRTIRGDIADCSISNGE